MLEKTKDNLYKTDRVFFTRYFTCKNPTGTTMRRSGSFVKKTICSWIYFPNLMIKRKSIAQFVYQFDAISVFFECNFKMADSPLERV